MSASARDSAAALTIKQEVDRRQQQRRRQRRQRRLRHKRLSNKKMARKSNATQGSAAAVRYLCRLRWLPLCLAPLPPTTFTMTTTTHIDKVVNLQSAVPSVDMSIHAHTHTLTCFRNTFPFFKLRLQLFPYIAMQHTVLLKQYIVYF